MLDGKELKGKISRNVHYRRNEITDILTREITLLISSHSNMTRKRTQPIPGSEDIDKSRVSTSTIRSPDELIRDTRISLRGTWSRSVQSD